MVAKREEELRGRERAEGVRFVATISTFLSEHPHGLSQFGEFATRLGTKLKASACNECPVRSVHIINVLFLIYI